MADTLPSPPVSRKTTPQPFSSDVDQKELTRQLDERLEQYLEVLDRYTILRESLSSSFAKGFISLANAQRNSNLGPGRRYGQDGYDGRMKALKRVNLREGNRQVHSIEPLTEPEHKSQINLIATETTKPNIEVYSFTPERGGTSATVNEKAVETQKLNTSTSSKFSEKAKADPVTTSPSHLVSETEKKPKRDPAYRDPLTWYGILIPPPLREAKKSFSESVDIIPDLLATKTMLESLEFKIWAIRAELGIMKQYSDDEFVQMVALSADSKAQVT